MKKDILIIFIIFYSAANVFASNIDSSYLKSQYEVVICYSESEEFPIPLRILKTKPVVTSTISNSLIIVDGVYCSDDGYYLEGLCRFKDKDGGKWEIKFSAEPFSKKGYSVFTIIIIKDGKVQQQNDFTFRGKPGDVMNMGISPFSIIGLHTIKDNWFSVSLEIK